MVYCSDDCRLTSLKTTKIDLKKMELHEGIEINIIESNTSVCKKFGCNKHLTLTEKLVSAYCLNHNHEKQLINKQNIYQ